METKDLPEQYVVVIAMAHDGLEFNSDRTLSARDAEIVVSKLRKIKLDAFIRKIG